jgi:hypothetical protein
MTRMCYVCVCVLHLIVDTVYIVWHLGWITLSQLVPLCIVKNSVLSLVGGPHAPIDVVITRVAASRSSGMTGIAFALDSEFEAVRAALIADVPRRVEVATLGVSYGGHWNDREMGRMLYEMCVISSIHRCRAVSERSTLSRTRDFAIMSLLICRAG